MQASTATAHYKTYDAKDWYELILKVMREKPDQPTCIADLKEDIQSRVTWTVEKSTVSARLNEMARFGEIEMLPKPRPSRSTGIMSRHYQIKVQPELF